MATPNWQGASTGIRPQAAQINQFLGSHTVTIVYAGTSFASQTTAGAGGTNSNGLYLAQSFNTGGSSGMSRVVLTLAVTGTPNPATVSIQSDNAGVPSGTVLGSTVLPPTFVAGSATAISIPVFAAVAAATQYWIVINAVGDVSNFYAWSRSNQVSGASTSPNGSTWTAQGYGFLYNCFVWAYVGAPVHSYEDGGLRWATFATNASGALSNLSEYTTAQAANDYVTSIRAFTYTNGNLTSIA